jgi:4-hydroxy-tetrahydrodipicolinate synthase
MSQLQLTGVIPSPPVVYTDESCMEVNYEGYRRHLRHLLAFDIGGLCIGGHAGETECLTMDERLKVIDVAVEEAKGRVPIIGGVIADSTHAAIEQAKRQKDHGVDAVLVCPPNIIGWDAERADDMHVAHFKAFDRAAQIPFLIYGGPGDGTSYRQLPQTFRKLAENCERLVAWKIPVRGVATGENSFASCVSALKEAGEITGRKVTSLIAGDANFYGALEVGADGNVNACESVRVEDNTALFEAFKKGDRETARKIQEKGQPLSDAIYGIRIGRSFTYFHYRFKIASWMLGYIDNPMMRLPQVPPPADEITIIYDALIKTGKEPVRSPSDYRRSIALI